MPTYDYLCRSCGSVTEVIHSMLEEGPSACERCGGELRRVLFPTGIIFKGSGFYRTDSRANGSRADKDAAAAKKSDASAGSSGSSTSDSSSTGESAKGDSTKGDSTKGGTATKSGSGSTPTPSGD